MKSTKMGAASVMGMALLAALAMSAKAQLVIPEQVPIPAEDEKAIRAMLIDYVKAVRAGDRAKAASFCISGGKDEEKVSKLGCEIDFAIEKLRAAVEKKLGRDAWGMVGEMLGEMTPEGMKKLPLKPTATADEVKVNWNEQSKVAAEKKLGSDVTIKRVKNEWKFQLVENKAMLAASRRWLRDAIAEIEELAGEVDAGRIKSKEDLEKTAEKLVKDLKSDGEGEAVPGVQPENAPGIEIAPAPAPGMIDQ